MNFNCYKSRTFDLENELNKKENNMHVYIVNKMG